MMKRVRKAIWKEKSLDKRKLGNGLEFRDAYRLDIEMNTKEGIMEFKLVLSNKAENL